MSQDNPAHIEIDSRKNAINPSKEFKKKRLCTHTLDVGILCDHGCTCCSTPSIMRTDTNFKKCGSTAEKEYHKHIVYINLNIPEMVKE